MRALAWFSVIVLTLSLGPSVQAQSVHASVGGNFVSLGDQDRFGVSGGFAFALTSGHRVELAPYFDYYDSRWNSGAGRPAVLWAVGVDARLNLPAIAETIRPYVGAGPLYIEAENQGRVGLNLNGGLLVRLPVRGIYVYTQGAYRLTGEFDTPNLLDAVFVQVGVRTAL